VASTSLRLKGHAGTSSTALLLIDFINDLDFGEGEQLAPYAIAAARATAALKTRADAAGVPAIYVNDNFGSWQSRFDQAVKHCRRAGGHGRKLATILAPKARDYFVLKPMHSGFYLTPLALLLEHLGVRRLVLTGLLADSCVLFTANDAYLRRYRITVPPDCVASVEPQYAEQALDHMRRNLKAQIRHSQKLIFEQSMSERS
jgi:Amidases related to nicotinamidase